MRSHGLDPGGAAIVVRSLGDPAEIAGAHAWAHAEERELYREAVESALRVGGLRVTTFVEKSVRSAAVAQLRLSGQHIDAMLKTFVRQVGTPWRAPEKQAALAAWLVLPSSAGRRRHFAAAASRERRSKRGVGADPPRSGPRHAGGGDRGY
jgi:hypothetical protein